MRIISGIYGGRRFDTPKNLQARPTTDIAKESLFNILQNRIDFEGISALDLFAGTGSISFELLSRGASHVVCVELAHVQQQFILHVIKELKSGHEPLLVRGDALKYLKNATGKFDLIFADPPYALQEMEKIPDLVFENDILKDEGIFILEHGKEQDFASHPRCFDQRKYGAVHFSFFK